jgi:signal transduction histidine kinase
MKVKSKLILLIVGSIIFPILVMGVTGYLGYRYFQEKEPISPRKIDRIIGYFEEELSEKNKMGKTGEDLRCTLDIPEGLDLFIIDTDNNILFSTIPDLPTLALGDTGLFFIDRQKDTKERHIMVVPLIVDSRVRANLVLRFPLQPLRNKKVPPFIMRILDRGIFVFGTVIVFSAVMVVLIMKSINRSIRNLERATRKVAKGQLDFMLKARGNDEFATLTNSFEAMRLELKENKEQRSRFLMGVSHDLKTPLTSITGYLEAILDGIADEPQKLQKYLAIIWEKSKVLEERIVQLIDFVKVERGEWRLKKEEIALGKFLNNIAKVYYEDAPVFRRNFSFHIDLPQDFTVVGDKNLLTRAFENLMTNAVQHTREGDAIMLVACRKDSGAVVSLKDTGPGISEAEIDKIFEPFYRGTSSRREQGTGLGLSMVKSIINSHGWSIDVVSRPNEGTDFIIYVTKTYSVK